MSDISKKEENIKPIVGKLNGKGKGKGKESGVHAPRMKVGRRQFTIHFLSIYSTVGTSGKLGRGDQNRKKVDNAESFFIPIR